METRFIVPYYSDEGYFIGYRLDPRMCIDVKKMLKNKNYLAIRRTDKGEINEGNNRSNQDSQS